MNMMIEKINSIGAAFVDFAVPMLAQSSALIVILLLVDFLLRRRVRAVFRYCIWMLVLAKLLLPSSLSSPLSFGYLFGDSLGNVTVSSVTTTAETVEMSQPLEMSREGEAKSVEAISAAPIVTPTTEGIEAVLEAAGLPVTSMRQVTWQGVVFLVWLVVVGAMGLLLLQRAIFVSTLVAQARNANSLMNDAFKYCCRCIGVKGKVGLKVSANATSPAVCGLFRPVILVPQNLGPSLGSSGLRTVLLHELAHIKRRDLWVNLVQTVLQIIYFYNPLLWLANAVIRRVREQAVDETVQVAMGTRAQQYPETLVNVAKLAFKRPALSLRLIGVVESKSALKGRIKRMLDRPIPKNAKLGLLGLAAVLIIGAVLLPMAATAGRPEFIIKGTVTDAGTGQPIAGAKVGDVDKYANGRQWTITDSDGKYSYATWYEEHGIKAEAPSYEIQHKGLYTKLFGSEKEKVLDFQLTPEKVSGPSKFKKTLPSGVTVELVGVCEHPSDGKQWWLPDGRFLSEAANHDLPGRVPLKLGKHAKEIAISFRSTYRKGVHTFFEIEQGLNTTYRTEHENDKGSDELLRGVAFLTDEHKEFIDISAGAAAGQWETVSSRSSNKIGRFINRMISRGIKWDEPVEINGKTVIFVKSNDVKRDIRIVAVDTNDKVITPILPTLYYFRGEERLETKAEFDIPLSDIKEFQYQTRTIEWVEFKNVSLKPNFKTDVEVVVEPVHYTQEMFNDIQPDGTILFKSTVKQVNQSGREIKTTGFINSDFVEVRSMSDSKGRPIEFTSTHEGNIYRYKVTFNEPVLPGEVMEYSHEGKIAGLIKQVQGKENQFRYRMTHWPATGQPTRRIETYLLPKGAEMISTTPENMERRIKYDGRIELHVDKMIPTGGSITTAFQYRLGGDKGEVEGIVEQAVMTISTCAESDPRVGKALESLRGLNEEAVVKELVKFLDSDRNTIRRSAIFVFWKGGLKNIEPAVSGLQELCSHKEDFTRGMAAIALGACKVSSSFDALCAMTLEDSSGYARRCAAYALGLMGRADAEPILEKALKDSDPLVRGNAETALTMLAQEGKSKSFQPTKTRDLQSLIDAARPGGTVIIPKGVYTEPVEISKSLTLKGESRTDCVFEVTADKPAIFIDTKGKGKVTVEDVTVKWQLATSDRVGHPFALGVKDSKAEVKNCYFQPLGNFKRSPVAVRAIGFTNLTISRCRFEGFAYTVCYGEGTQGTIQDSLVMNSGHQGISLYNGATVNIYRNIVTGSKYHGVRSTGGTLRMKDNLVIANANRGVYLGNKSARGTITNNVIMGNATGIDGFAQSKVKIENNVIADSSYAGIGMRETTSLLIRNNIFQNNERGWILFEGKGKGGNTSYRNTFWENKVDAENFRKTANSIEAAPPFVDPENGDFSLKPGPALEHKQGLTNPRIFKTLWKRWQNREDKNEPFRGTGITSEKISSDADKRASENLAANGWRLWRQRKLAEAEEVFKKAVEKDPTNANTWNGLGWSQSNQGKVLNAKVSFEKCLAIDPKHTAALNGLGWIAKRQGKTEEAIGHWEKAVEAAPTATAALSGLGQAYMELKRYDKAANYYQMWLNVESNNAQAKSGLEKAKLQMTDVGVVERGQHTISTKAEVFGKVTQEGDPSSNARIIARVYSNNSQPGVDSPLISRKTRTDEEGYYHIYNLPAGKLSVAVMSAVGNLNVAQKNLELMPGQKLELDFGDEPGYTVTGTITLDDEPIELAEIFMSPEIPEDYSFRKWGWTNEDGRFRITGLAKGAYRAFIHYDTGLDPETFLWSEGESFGDFRKINIDGDLTLDVSLFSNKAYPNYMTVEDESAEQVALLRLVGLEHRVESAKKLSGLGKALIIYANDHEEKYPDTLQELRPYNLNERDFQWLIDNVEYLGKGKPLTISPQAVIAYDKSLFEKGNGTNVLFNDSHVEFVNPEQLKKLGIKPGQKTDVEVEVRWRPSEDPMTVGRSGATKRKEEVLAKLRALSEQRNRVQRDLAAAERALQDVRVASGLTDLEERSYRHPVTERLMRLVQERDNCVLEIAQVKAKIKNLHNRGVAEELENATDNLVALEGKLEALDKMVEEAKARKRDLDLARVQYKQRARIRDERQLMLDSLKAQIEQLRIVYDEVERAKADVETERF